MGPLQYAGPGAEAMGSVEGGASASREESILGLLHAPLRSYPFFSVFQLTLTLTLPSDLKRQCVLAAAFVEQILHGLRTEQIANHFAGLSHQWAQWATDRVRASARFPRSVHGARQRSDGAIQ
jgi:hypothetical protein